jgi:hypothetical protein
MSETKDYRVRIRKGEIEFEVQGDKIWVEAESARLQSEFFNIEEPDHETGSQDLGEQGLGPLPETLNQFYIDKNEPQKHGDKALVFAYWLEKHGAQSWNIKDIEGCYDLLRLGIKPKNFSDIINNINKSYLIITTNKDGLKAWKLSAEGLKDVESIKKVA